MDSCMSSKDFEIELNSICLEGGELDLHLAAELGKTLLDRNRELETHLKEKQSTIEDQKLEIEYLTKQTVALKEVNDSRLRIYEQLEVSIQDLERTNHRLQFENGSERKHVKSLNATIEQLEGKNEELQGVIDELRLQIDVLKKKALRSSDVGLSRSANQSGVTLRHVLQSPENEELPATPPSSHPKQDKCSGGHNSRFQQTFAHQRPECDQNSTEEPDQGMEEMAQLLAQLRETRAQCSKDERIIGELQEQLTTLEHQNQALEHQVVQLSHRGDDLNMKSMHEELNSLDEVRQGQVCSKCLRTVDQSSELDLAEDDDQSMLDALNATQHRASFSMNVKDHANSQSSPLPTRGHDNPYEVLVKKYEALVEVHRGNPGKTAKSDQCPSLQDEMQLTSGDFVYGTSTKDTDEESGHGGSLRTGKQTRKTFSTPTDFSEAETSSSGYAEETSNKGTQTESNIASFLCKIVDGEDCVSIYDEATPFDSRFRDLPEYRDLFVEIFKVLKIAAEKKAGGEELPLLPATPAPLQPMAAEFLDDDTQSVLSSTMSELSTQNEGTTIVENIIQAQNQPIPEAEEPTKAECVLRPLVRQPLEYVSVEVRKRSSSRRKNKFSERSDSPITHIIGSPKITYSSRPNSGKKRRDVRSSAPEEDSVWNGSTLQFWASDRNAPSPTPSQGSTKGYLEFKPSLASQDLNKLKKLDLSYAEVLRKADTKKRELYRQRRK
ncbi:uncharacterized protein LOC109539565 isoform X2 [Dendroctonus ponderosae]|uniref:Cerebellar degeneration-related protein 2-like n=1 Tax=Dendroctonus ponderosae TaxID=77166 RepID=A0AAR5PPT5_DENPD|nr:uncharacterized protein LOC109539565 isoform X2 [Dendroctonus ponderosae]